MECIDAADRQRVAALLARHTPEHGKALSLAIETACNAHHDQLRKSGEPYYLHALAVAEILDELNLDYETLVAAVLHDVVEDTSTTLGQVGDDFGPTIARMVDGVTKMERIGEFRQQESVLHKDAEQAESLRKLLLAMAEDVRVVLIKLADRLHNMRTLRHLDRDRQRRIAQETLDIYAPLANRLGIWQIKWELEDLSLRYLEPEAYQEIARQLAEKRTNRESYISRVIGILEQQLAEAGIDATITGRSKHIYSIWRKMQRKQLGFEQIFDMHAVRILVDEEKDCYAALGIVHGLWRHIPREFDDYIANPKENLYRSLHTAVVAAHWRYKEGGGTNAGYEEKITWLRQLLEWREEERTATDFVDRFKSEAFQDRVYVLTPQGRIIDLPQGATPLDFAYAVHTEVGHRCRGAKVNGRIVPLTYSLQNGEQVEILTTRQGRPSRDWLNSHLGYLHTSRARSRVRAWFKQQDYEHNLGAGRSILDRELHRVGLSAIAAEKIAERFRGRQVDEFLVALGSGEITTGQLARSLGELVPKEEPLKPRQGRQRRKKKAGTAGGFDIQGVGNLMTTTARCCRPVPNDPIIGYITRGRGVTIHRQDCGNILRLRGEDRDRLITVDWGQPDEAGYQVDILVEAYDRAGLLRDITSLLASEKINLTSANTRTDAQDGIAYMNLTLEIADISQLSRVLTRIGQLQNVISARRKV